MGGTTEPCWRLTSTWLAAIAGATLLIGWVAGPALSAYFDNPAWLLAGWVGLPGIVAVGGFAAACAQARFPGFAWKMALTAWVMAAGFATFFIIPARGTECDECVIEAVTFAVSLIVALEAFIISCAVAAGARIGHLVAADAASTSSG